jgi:hypothetical protein
MRLGGTMKASSQEPRPRPATLWVGCTLPPRGPVFFIPATDEPFHVPIPSEYSFSCIETSISFIRYNFAFWCCLQPCFEFRRSVALHVSASGVLTHSPPAMQGYDFGHHRFLNGPSADHSYLHMHPAGIHSQMSESLIRRPVAYLGGAACPS